MATARWSRWWIAAYGAGRSRSWRLAAGEVVEPSLYYFRTTPRFEVQDGPHQWLADHVFVCRGHRRPDAVELEIFRVL
jgi:hypothetical protein